MESKTGIKRSKDFSTYKDKSDLYDLVWRIQLVRILGKRFSTNTWISINCIGQNKSEFKISNFNNFLEIVINEKFLVDKWTKGIIKRLWRYIIIYKYLSPRFLVIEKKYYFVTRNLNIKLFYQIYFVKQKMISVFKHLILKLHHNVFSLFVFDSF